MHRPAEEITQFLVDDIQIGIQVGRQDMMRAGAVGLIAFSGVTGLKYQVAILNA